MALIKTEAIVLRAANYRDRSKILTLYTKSHGKLSVIAKGVRDAGTRWGGVLQSMAYLNALLYFKENRTLHLLSNAEYVRSFKSIFENSDKMNVGFRIIELINKTTADCHEIKGIFELITGSLNNLEDATKNYVNVLFNFEFRLAGLLGFAVDVNEENTAGLRLTGNSVLPLIRNNQAEVLKIISYGNIEEIMELDMKEADEIAVDRYFENHFRLHFDNLDFSNTKKVIFSKEMRL